MAHEHDHNYERRACVAIEQGVCELAAIQDVLELLVEHQLGGGLSPEDVERMKMRMQALSSGLRAKRQKLQAALDAANQPPQ